MSSFQERQKSLFNQLKDAEEQFGFSNTNKVTSPIGNCEVDTQTYRKVKREMKQFRGRESIFKRPEAKLSQCLRAKTTPGYIKNPQKWAYYSLSDVTADQMSDATNTATALALIQKMEEQEDPGIKMEQDDADDSLFKKPTFRVSAQLKKEPKQEEDEKPTFKSTKVLMPEYVVGVSQKKTKKEKPPKTISDTNSKRVELRLQHLYEVDD